MEYRVLVMNGQRLLQSTRDGKWVTDKVDKAGAIQPGIYPLSGAVAARHSKSYRGGIVHVDREHVYQQSGKLLVRHCVQEFKAVPFVGQFVAIFYKDAMAQVTLTNQALRKSVRR